MKIEGQFFDEKGEKVTRWFEAGNETVLRKQLERRGWRVIRILRVDRTKKDLPAMSTGILNFGWGFVLILATIVTKFQIWSFAVLGPLYFVLGICLIDSDAMFRKVLFAGVLPVSAVALINLLIFKSPYLPALTQMTIPSRFMIGLTMLALPFLGNFFYGMYAKQKKAEEEKKKIVELPTGRAGSA